MRRKVYVNYPYYFQAIIHMALSRCIVFLLIFGAAPIVYSNFYQDVDVAWGQEHVYIFNDAQDLQLTLDNVSGIFWA